MNVQNIIKHLETRVFSITQRILESKDTLAKEARSENPIEKFTISAAIDLHRDRKIVSELKDTLKYIRGGL